MRRYYLFFAILTVVSLAAVAAQAAVSGPIKADQELSMRISQTSNEIQNYQSINGKLPDNLDVLDGDHTGITYAPKTGSYELCATFRTAHERRPADTTVSVYIEASNHPKGYHCFKALASSTSRYPVDKPVR